MAYGNRFRYRFDSVHGVEYNIYILKDGYTGTCDQRPLGRAPILKKKQNGPICGTSLELYAECAVDGEYRQLYTTNPKQFKVEVYRGGTLIWFGFVSTELYAEPSIAPPYDVQIVATDGLGELKQNKFEAQGERSLLELLQYIFGFTGSDRDFYFATNLMDYPNADVSLLDWLTNMDFMVDKTCYDVLATLLDSLHATITAYGNRWLIARENDIETLLDGSGNLEVIDSTDVLYSTTTISGAVKSVGQMGVADLYPNGSLSMKKEPARKSVSVIAPWYRKDYLRDQDMTRTATPAYWTKDANTQFDSADQRGYFIGTTVQTTGLLYQSVLMEYMKCGVVIRVKAGPSLSTYVPGSGLNGSLMLYAEYRITGGYSNPMVGTEKGWVQNNYGDVESIDLGEIVPVGENIEEYSITIPPLGSSDNGELRICIKGKRAYVNYATIELTGGEGYQDTIFINNGARGEGDEVEIMGGRIPSEGLQNIDYYYGVWRAVGLGYIKKFMDSNFSGLDFLSIQAMNRARSIAAVRERTEGIVDFPSGLTFFPILISQGQQLSFVETFEWDLRNDDVTISALSLPDVTLSVESEQVVPLEETAGYSSGGSSPGGSGGGSSTPGTSLLSVWRSLTNNSNLDDYDADTLIAIEHLAALFTVETRSSGGQTYYYLKLNTNYEGLTAAGYITAGAAAASSDARLKDDVKAIDPARASALLAALRGCEWTWNGLKEFLAGSHGSGLIAQEVAKVLPWAVIDLGGELSLNYNALWGIAVPVMQDQQRRIKDLERRVSQLEKALDNILKKDV